MRRTRWGRACLRLWICGKRLRALLAPHTMRTGMCLDILTRLAANQPSYTHHTPTAVPKPGSSASNTSSRRRRPCWWSGGIGALGTRAFVSSYSIARPSIPLPPIYPFSLEPPFLRSCLHPLRLRRRIRDANIHIFFFFFVLQNSPPTSRPCIPRSASRSCTRARGFCRGSMMGVREEMGKEEKRVGACVGRVSVSFTFSLGLRTARAGLSR
jgi:hypothetical protein